MPTELPHNDPNQPIEAGFEAHKMDTIIQKLDATSKLNYPADFKTKLEKNRPDLYETIAALDGNKSLYRLGKAQDALDQYLGQEKINDAVDAMRKWSVDDPRRAISEKELHAIATRFYAGDTTVLAELGTVMDKIINAPVKPAVAPAEAPMDRSRFLKENGKNLKNFYRYDRAGGSIVMKFDSGSDADKFLSIGDIMKDIFKDMNDVNSPKFLIKNGVKYHYTNGTNGRFESTKGSRLTVHSGDTISILRTNEQIVENSSVIQALNSDAVQSMLDAKKS